MQIAFVEDNFLRWELGDAFRRSNVTKEFLLTQWESFIDTYAAELTRRGHACAKFVPSFETKRETVYQHDLGHKVVVIPCGDSVFDLLKRLDWRLGAVRFTQRLMKENFVKNCDVLHYHSIYSSFFLASACLPKSIKRTVQYSGGAFPGYVGSIRGAAVSRVLRSSIGSCHGVLVNEPNALTRGQIAFLKRNEGVPDTKFLPFAGVAIDPKKFRDEGKEPSRTILAIKNDALVMVSVGGIVDETPDGSNMNKNQFALIRIFSLLSRILPAAELHIVGGGTAINRLRQLVKDMDLTARVHIHGVVPHDSVPAYLSAADLVAVPIGVFDFYGGTAILESFACNRPVCAFSLGGAGSFDAMGGFIMDPNSNLSARALAERLSNSEYLKMKAEEGRVVVEGYLKDKVISQLENILSDVAGS
ncbi:MAG: glycosyltransferase family 4 protein [Thaumarchaeota archaeon]|nr:glycosyltransferase family 4 protein [Nitrososphaerota archaeon]